VNGAGKQKNKKIQNSAECRAENQAKGSSQQTQTASIGWPKMKSLTPKIIKTQSQHQINAFRVPLNARNACVCVCVWDWGALRG